MILPCQVHLTSPHRRVQDMDTAAPEVLQDWTSLSRKLDQASDVMTSYRLLFVKLSTCMEMGGCKNKHVIQLKNYIVKPLISIKRGPLSVQTTSCDI